MGASGTSRAATEPPVECPVCGGECPICARRRRRTVVAAKVLAVLLIAAVLALVTKLFPSWAASIQVANLLVMTVVAWLLARGPQPPKLR